MDTYSPGTGLIYVFNLIVGTGALTMPAAFTHAGWLLSVIIISLLALMSYVTATFVIECMSIANAVIKIRQLSPSQLTSPSSSSNCTLTKDECVGGRDHSPELTNNSENVLSPDQSTSGSFLFGGDEEPAEESQPLMGVRGAGSVRAFQTKTHNFDITERVELGQMANMFFPKLLVTIFYICIALYLFGDLAIYAAAIAKSLRDISCTWEHPCNGSLTPPYAGSDMCWENVQIDRTNAYRLYILAVLVFLGPFAFFNVQKTKYIQILTSLFRWFSFTSMIVLAGIALGKGKGRGHPAPAHVGGLPNLFGVCVYSFMCHHSLPSLITPIDKKRKIYWLLFADYLLILVFYLLLSFSGSLAFDNLADIYTLNFQKDKCHSGKDDIVPSVAFLQYFLPLFPVFTLSASFPIISITLSSNLKALLLPLIAKFQSRRQQQHTDSTSVSVSLITQPGSAAATDSFFVNRILFPVVAVVPPVLFAIVTENLQALVGFTGSYAGTSIQYVIPALLVYYARKHNSAANDDELALEGRMIMNSFRSPFKHMLWVLFVLAWAALSVILVTIDHIIE